MFLRDLLFNGAEEGILLPTHVRGSDKALRAPRKCLKSCTLLFKGALGGQGPSGQTQMWQQPAATASPCQKHQLSSLGHQAGPGHGAKKVARGGHGTIPVVKPEQKWAQIRFPC